MRRTRLTIAGFEDGEEECGGLNELGTVGLEPLQ
jgi:hypothetical protein